MISAFGDATSSGDSQTLNAQEVVVAWVNHDDPKTSALWATFGKQNWRYGMNRKRG